MKTFSKKIDALILVVAIAVAHVYATGWAVPQERITYDVMYKWGLINKKAGSATITTQVSPASNEFKAHLAAASAPWADKYFMVRDTLRGTIDKKTFLPSYYEKVAHEGGAYDRDILHYTRTGDTATATAKMWRKRKKETDVRRLDDQTHTAEGLTLDMLSAFYYMRRLPYETMKKGESVTVNVFSGKKKEILTIHFDGETDVELNKHKYPAYHITFTFTTSGGKVSSDNMDAWISTAPGRIPLLLEGKLPVGKVRALYTGTVK